MTLRKWGRVLIKPLRSGRYFDKVKLKKDLQSNLGMTRKYYILPVLIVIWLQITI